MASPVATDDLNYSVFEDEILRVNPGSGVLANDTDDDNDALAAHVVTNTGPRNPLFDFKTNGSFTYDARYHGTLYIDTDGVDPTLSASGDAEFTLVDGLNSLAAGAIVYDTFTYEASDGVTTDQATVRVKIEGVNDAPVADEDSATVTQGQSVSIDALDGDTDVDIWPTKDVLAIIGLVDLADDTGGSTESDADPSDGLSITTLEGGTVTLAADGTLTYVAADGFFGIDTFEYTLSDGNGGVDAGLVRVTVLPANLDPVAADDGYSVGEDAGNTGFSTVLANDTDADDAPLIAAELSDPIASALRRVASVATSDTAIAGATGALTDFNSDGTFSYDPNGEFESLGEGDSAFVAFDYIAYDGHDASDEATVVIEIEGANDNPTGESPDAVKVYEAGLDTGSGDHRDETGNLLSAIPIVRNIDITIDDVDASDTPFVAGTTGGDTTTLTGAYGTLEFVDDDTVRYTLTSNADHSALQGHNGGVFDIFTVYVVDEHDGFSDPLTVTVEVIDDVNFLVNSPVDADGAPILTVNPLEDKSLAFSSGASTSDAFTLVPGADGQTLDIVGIPDTFTLADGRTVTSSVVTDEAGVVVVEGTTPDGDDADTDPDLFYTLTINSDPDGDLSTLLGEYTLEVWQNPPVVVNDLDFAALRAGGPQETVTVEGIGFNGAFFDGSSPIKDANLNDPGLSTTSDDINTNSSGGIGIGNGNIDRGEVLIIDVTGSSGTVTALEFDVKGAGGGVAMETLLWEAYLADGTLVESGTIPRDFSSKNALTLEVDPGGAFDFLYVGMDSSTFDSNDTVRINRVATIEEVASDDIVLPFAFNSDDGDGDQSPAASETPDYETFQVTILGEGDGALTPDLILV